MASYLPGKTHPVPLKAEYRRSSEVHPSFINVTAHQVWSSPLHVPPIRERAHFYAPCNTQHGWPNQINRLFSIECCSQGDPKQIKRHHCTQIQQSSTVSWSRGMCLNSSLNGMKVCFVSFGLNSLSVDRESGKTLPSAGYYEKYSQADWASHHTNK